MSHWNNLSKVTTGSALYDVIHSREHEFWKGVVYLKVMNVSQEWGEINMLYTVQDTRLAD